MDQKYLKLTYYRSFGDMLRQKRQVLGMSVRKLSQKLGFDAGNLSKIERGALPPPADFEILSQLAKALAMEKGSYEYQKFIDWAYLCQRRIPPDIPLNRLLNCLPDLFRNIRDAKPLRIKDLDKDDV